jgi:hypothetical protein
MTFTHRDAQFFASLAANSSRFAEESLAKAHASTGELAAFYHARAQRFAKERDERLASAYAIEADVRDSFGTVAA